MVIGIVSSSSKRQRVTASLNHRRTTLGGKQFMRKTIGKSVLASLSLVLLLITGAAYGQGGAAGTILGTVTDVSGAVIPNAKVTITSTGTGIAHVTETTGAGDYAVPDLVPGPYRVDVEAAGFSKAQVGGTTLQVAQQ